MFFLPKKRFNYRFLTGGSKINVYGVKQISKQIKCAKNRERVRQCAKSQESKRNCARNFEKEYDKVFQKL